MMERPNPSSPNQHLNPSPITSRHFSHPPISPYSQIPPTLQPKHSRSFSQSPISVSLVERNCSGFTPSLPPSMCRSTPRIPENLPPRKSHRRSNSDVTFGFGSMIPHTPNSPPSKDWSNLVKEERGRISETESMDDLFRAYMNVDALNSFGGGKTGDETVERTRRKTNGGSSSDSEGERGNNVKVTSGVKRRATGGDIAPTTRHHRSVSMDSCFLDKLNEPPQKLPTNSGEGKANAFSVEFGNSEFTAAEMKKISADDKLSEIVMADPKRVKRILANRVSAARSKERKTQYIVELEHKVQTLQIEATTLSAQLTHLQRDYIGLTHQNNELKFRLQAMEEQAQLRDALTEKLTEEVQRLKLVIGEPTRPQSGSSKSEMSLSPDMFQQLRISQLQHQQMHHSNQN